MRLFKSVLLLGASLFLSMAANADGIIESWQCELKDDAKIEDVQAINSKWLKWVNDHTEAGEVTSSLGTTVVGNLTRFIFVDSYPDMATWAAVKDALESDEGNEIDGMFNEVSECSENRLWRMESTK
jgi:hypothetical protein